MPSDDGTSPASGLLGPQLSLLGPREPCPGWVDVGVALEPESGDSVWNAVQTSQRATVWPRRFEVGVEPRMEDLPRRPQNLEIEVSGWCSSVEN